MFARKIEGKFQTKYKKERNIPLINSFGNIFEKAFLIP